MRRPDRGQRLHSLPRLSRRQHREAHLWDREAEAAPTMSQLIASLQWLPARQTKHRFRGQVFLVFPVRRQALQLSRDQRLRQALLVPTALPMAAAAPCWLSLPRSFRGAPQQMQPQGRAHAQRALHCPSPWPRQKKRSLLPPQKPEPQVRVRRQQKTGTN